MDLMAVRVFGTLASGAPVHAVAIGSDALTAEILDIGAVIRRLDWHGAPGGVRPLVLGLDEAALYETASPHMGAIAGRFGNRIGHGRLEIDGTVWSLPINHAGLHHLHGGPLGFGRRLWRIADHGPDFVDLALTSEAGDMGYPGRVEVGVRYAIVGNTLSIRMTGTTDAPTVLNLATHSYFNLDDSADILDHRVTIAASAYCPVDGTGLVTGAILPVAGTPWDFRSPRPVRLAVDGDLVRYDNNFMRGLAATVEPTFAARVEGARGDCVLEVWTTEPGIQFFDAAPIQFPAPGLDGRRYGPRAGLCLEPQRFPDSPNQPHFPGALLRPGETYGQVTEYRFAFGR
jgi:aldose 1-epimerase